MSNFTTEAKVGVFVLIAIGVLIYLTFKVGSLDLSRGEQGLKISAAFTSIAGLEPGANVRYAGVKIGTVEGVQLEGGFAKVDMSLNPGVSLRADSVATVASLGLLGEKYIEIKGGTQNAPLVLDGGAVKGSSPTSLDQLVESVNGVGNDLKAITESFREVVGSEKGKESLNRILENIDLLTADLRTMVSSNSSQIDEIVGNVESLTRELKTIVLVNQASINQAVANFEELSGAMQKNLPSILENLDRVLLNVNELVAGNKSNVQESMENIKFASRELQSSMEHIDDITAKINSGEGTLGKLISDDETHDNLNTALVGLNETLEEAKGFLGGISSYETFLGYRGEYLQEHDQWKNVISVRVQPRKDKYYLIELVDSPFGNKTWEEEDITTDSSVTGLEYKHIRRETTSDELTFTLQVAKRLRDFTFRGGLIESSGGIGADLNLFRDNLRLSVDGWDFSREDNFHLKLTSDLVLYDYFHVYAGLDDLLIEDNLSGYFGFGLSFADDDFKFLLGLLPLAGASP